MTKNAATKLAHKNSVNGNVRYVVRENEWDYSVYKSVDWGFDAVVAIFEDGEFFHPEEC